MEIKKISTSDALALCGKAESHFFDKKSKDVGGTKLQKAVVAFANADGGELLIGIADDKESLISKERWQGFESIEKMNYILQVLFDITPSLSVKQEVLECKGFDGFVLRLLIERGSQVYHCSDRSVYVRKGAQSLPLPPDRIAELSYAKGVISFENERIPDCPPELVVESEELMSFLLGSRLEQ